MRIVAGRFKGRKLTAPPGRELRPTSDRIRESVFNVLAHGVTGFDLADASVVDLFAGTGALGLEALSRGAAHATFIEVDRGHLGVIKKNAAQLGTWREVTLLNLDATRLPPPPLAAKAPCRLVFMDAPYDKGLTAPTLMALARSAWIKPGAVIVAEVAAKETLEVPRSLEMLDERVYGAARVVFLHMR